MLSFAASNWQSRRFAAAQSDHGCRSPAISSHIPIAIKHANNNGTAYQTSYAVLHRESRSIALSIATPNEDLWATRLVGSRIVPRHIKIRRSRRGHRRATVTNVLAAHLPDAVGSLSGVLLFAGVYRGVKCSSDNIVGHNASANGQMLGE